MSSDSCLLYDSTNSACSVCLPGYINDGTACSVNCTDPDAVPIPRIASCDRAQQLIAFIDGGDRSVPVSQPLTLDASLSKHTGDPTATLLYTWFCTAGTASDVSSCYVPSGVNFNTPTTSLTLTIPANSYSLKTTYHFTIRVEANGLTSFYSVQIKFTNQANSISIHYNPSLTAICNSKSYDFWVTSSDASIAVRWMSSFNFDLINQSYVRTRPFNNEDLVYNSYTITAESGTTSTTVTFPLSPQATGGNMTITPTSGGIPFQTTYLVTMDSYTHIDGGTLSYAFSYCSNKSNFQSLNDRVLVSNFSSSTSSPPFYLPNYSPIRIYGSILDATGCVTNVSFDVNLTTSHKTSIAEFQDFAAFATSLSSSVGIGNINMLIDELQNNDDLLDCKFNLDYNSEICYTGQIPYRCTGMQSCALDATCQLSRCRCSEGYYLADCSMDNETYQSQLSSRQSLITFAESLLSQTTDQDTFLAALKLLEMLTEHAHLNTNSTYAVALDTLDVVAGKLNSITPQDKLASIVQTAGEVISNVLNATIEKDCGLATNFSLTAISSSFGLIASLSNSLLKATNADETILSTDTWISHSKVVLSSQLSNLQIAPGTTFPQAQFGQVTNAAALPQYVVVNYIYLKKDPATCNDSQSLSFTLQVSDSNSTQNVTVEAPVQVTYPSQTFPDVTCDANCNQTTDGGGNTMCLCPNATVFSPENQLIAIYNKSRAGDSPSNLHIPREPVSNRWSFWVTLGYTLFFMASLAIVRTVNKTFCLVEKVRKAKKQNKEIGTFSKFFVFVLVSHPLTNPFTFDDPCIRKEFRVLLFYVRQLGVLTFSAVFVPTHAV